MRKAQEGWLVLSITLATCLPVDIRSLGDTDSSQMADGEV